MLISTLSLLPAGLIQSPCECRLVRLKQCGVLILPSGEGQFWFSGFSRLCNVSRTVSPGEMSMVGATNGTFAGVVCLASLYERSRTAS